LIKIYLILINYIKIIKIDNKTKTEELCKKRASFLQSGTEKKAAGCSAAFLFAGKEILQNKIFFLTLKKSKIIATNFQKGEHTT